MENFRIELDADGIAAVFFDVPGRSMNTLTDRVMAELPVLIGRLRDDPAIRGVVLCSGKRSGFCAGADLGDLVRLAGTRTPPPPLSLPFRSLETIGKPVAAALEGLALGGGLELALACHYRVVADDPGIRLGLPEVTIGLLPGAGGTQRLPRLCGVKAALPLLLEGRPVDPARALTLGFVDVVVAPETVLDTARRWVREQDEVTARWDRPDYRLPGGDPEPGDLAAELATLRERTFGNYPALEFILRSVYEGAALPMDAGLQVETERFIDTFATPQARDMVRTLFLSRQALDKAAKGKAGDDGRAACGRHILDAGRDEARRMLDEGIAADAIIKAARQAGMTAPVLENATPPPPAISDQEQTEALVQRLLTRQALAGAALLAEGTASDPRIVDVGAVTAGFPAWTGGPLSYIDAQRAGAFVGLCDRLATRHGLRFTVPDALRALAKAGGSHYGAPAP